MVDELSLFNSSVPCNTDDRNFGQFSDHVTVWIDKHIGEKDTYTGFKNKFEKNIQVLKSNNPTEAEIDDESMLCADQDMLQKLTDEVYCLKYFSTPEQGLEYIRKNSNKKIFFISSGTIGQIVVPQIANLSQIQGIYIFCGNISYHTEWAGEYAENLSAILEHQDDLLQRLTRDIAIYVEEKGDRYKADDELLKARNCYAWTKKLLVRGKMLGDRGANKLIEKLTMKINEVQTSASSPSDS